MLSHISFQNFKAWKNTGPVRLAPITVFFGSNSAGKTSVPQLLLLLKQTAESSDRQRVLQLGDGRTLVDLGTYSDLIHNHDLEKPFSFQVEWTLAEPLAATDLLSSRDFLGDRIAFSTSLYADKRQQPAVDFLEYRLVKDQQEILSLRMQRRESTSKFDLVSKGYDLVRQQGRAWPLPEPVKFYGFPDEVSTYYQNASITSDLAFQFEKMLRSVYYVGPLREYPSRLYLWSGEIPDHVGSKGDRAIEAILAAGDRHFNWAAKQRTKTLDIVVAERLRNMGLIHDFKVEPLGAHRKEYEVLVRTRPQMPVVKLTDVGFGVSQVLPVIVECFYVPSNSIVIFEQPEIHLHPRVQADLADLFVDAVNARESATSRNCQFIIESHSEHFLRRLQRRIAEEAIRSEDVALYFVDIAKEGAVLAPLEVDLFGNINNWPDGFFGDEMEDVVARKEAQARRSKSMKKAG